MYMIWIYDLDQDLSKSVAYAAYLGGGHTVDLVNEQNRAHQIKTADGTCEIIRSRIFISGVLFMTRFTQTI